MTLPTTIYGSINNGRPVAYYPIYSGRRAFEIVGWWKGPSAGTYVAADLWAAFSGSMVWGLDMLIEQANFDVIPMCAGILSSFIPPPSLLVCGVQKNNVKFHLISGIFWGAVSVGINHIPFDPWKKPPHHDLLSNNSTNSTKA